MGDVQHLHDQEGIKKLKQLAEDINYCMFCTQVHDMPFDTRPMATQEVDEQGNFWFFSGKNSHKNQELKQDDHVQLIYAKPGDSEFLTVYGQADVFYDREKIDELWNPFVKTWFQEGKDDPNLTLVRVRPQEAYYWDTKNSRAVSLLKIAAGAITGKTMDDGIEGEIKI